LPYFKLTHYPHLTVEQNGTLFLFCPVKEEWVMVRAVVEEAAALASLALFIGMLAIWAQVIAVQ
jgi:hypothetical protein